ncbi:hypothetical protein GOARA_061_00240 [Gordonia araii NBRC 100433]|uniref:CHAT domain-containing protein n=1 Tax=Gordonia araii NBRC 100433 TaxID=1073574 RepID=G7H410_9ACTN|nr:CHAT domain-containing protein [Gordonia araii]NNG96350.1 CHAT domain-containing protein [Gordonia araii NBRC 100433]GAB10585.1 hypothetical protein GOARA_061_00240 [Gordonia araii NBRC 100433]
MPETPTLLVKYAEAGDGYLTWRWVGDDGPADFDGVAHIGADVLTAVRAALAEAVPDPLPGESIGDGVDRALLRGPLARPESTAAFARELGVALVPIELAETVQRSPTRPLLRVQPSESLTRVPWEMLRVGRSSTSHQDGIELGEIADVVCSAPASVAAQRSIVPTDIVPADREGSVVAVVDPRIPGQSASSALGSVLGRPDEASPLAALLTENPVLVPTVSSYGELARRTDVDRDWLRHTMAVAARLLYVGHVSAASASGESVDAALHLCCADERGAHRPLSVYDLLTGGYRFPPRTALIGCNSGGDLAHPDGMGLSMAALATGARLVTATRWAVPTNRALARAGNLGDRRPLEELVLAVDAAHRGDDPLGALALWQRDRRARWYADGQVADSPLMWAALTSTV